MIYFLHGLKSNAKGLKASALREKYPQISCPVLPPDPWKRHDILLDHVQAPALLVGSSLGGLSALLLARDVPERVLGMVLIAPAVGFSNPEYRTPALLALVANLVVPPTIPTTIIAGLRDEVIPLTDICDLVERSPRQANIRFLSLDDDHRLNSAQAHTAMLAAVASYQKLETTQPPTT